MLDIKRLRLLWELHNRGTIAAVAEALNFTPSGISQQLALLEREAGVQLLRKSGRRLELTPAAEALVPEIEQLLNGLERAEAVLHRTGEEITGTIRVAAFQTVLLALFPAVVQRLRLSAPKLRIELMQYEPEAALSETWTRRFDLVVAEQYPGHARPHFPGLDRIPLMHDRIQLALPPLGIGGGQYDHITSVADARELPWVMEPAGAATRHWAEETCRVAGFEPDVRFVTADLQAHVRLVETGNAVALLPSLVHLREPTVRLIDLEDAPRRHVFTAARRASAGDAAIAAVRATLAEVVAELPAV